MPDRNVRNPRVVIPRRTDDFVALCVAVFGHMEANEANEPYASVAQFGLISSELDDLQGDLSNLLGEAKAAEADAAMKRAQIKVKMEAAGGELRNLRDLLFAIHPDNPMIVTQFGFTAYTSSDSSGGADGSGDDGATDDGSGNDGTGGDDPLIDPV